uniref:Uncharacterized protein n=1 Tax=Solanum tuberosum TaxID=4113 RepID=M1C454_SOLTU
MPFSVRDALESWSSRDVEKAIKSMLMMIPGVIFGVYGQRGTKGVLMEFQLLEIFCEADV